MQAEEGRERWQARLDRLRDECSTKRASAREEVARLAAGSEEAEEAARAAAGAEEEQTAALRAALAAELSEVKTENMNIASIRCVTRLANQ